MSSLAAYVKAPPGDTYVTECEQAAAELVGNLIGTRPVPERVRELAELHTGANLYQQREATTDVASWSPDGVSTTPWRPARDPLTKARALLAPYLGPGVA